jgi:3-hydroxyacyl-CoA dehydrogenase/enoyl-CoA hydratase/3-hydroxybutyryl-CoA epimerase
MTEAIRYEKDNDNIVALTIDMPGQSANTMNGAFLEAFGAAVDRVEAEKNDIAGVVITSAKKTFFAGGDLGELIQAQAEDAQALFDNVQTMKANLRRMETLGKPVVAAINGAALGGGWELALACHGRVALAGKQTQIGLPEVTLGLLPGGGGVVRMVRLLGIQNAIPYLVEGKKVDPERALKAGLIHAVVETPEELIASAKQWIKDNPNAKAPWDEKGYKIPGGTPASPKTAQMLLIAPAILRGKTKGVFPAPEAIMAAAVEGAQVDFETATRIESRYFVKLVLSQVAKNMIGTFWFQLNELNAGASRPQGIDKHKTKKVGILGAGMMGAGIAYASATCGIEVVLKDISLEAAEKGKGYTEKLLAKRVQKGRMAREKMDSILSLITPTMNAEDLQGCDLIIEAVFEDQNLKAKVTQEAEAQIPTSAVFASNTSTLPITGLAEAAKRPEQFIGLHFFSPVDKMQLVEIIVGEKTNDETLAKAFDYVQQIKKTPIVVNDSRGFYTSRIFGTFLSEGAAMLEEGVNPQSIESGALQAGMPVGPLAVSDEVTLTLGQHVRAEAKKAAEAAGQTYEEPPGVKLVDEMVDVHKRGGKSTGAGYYEYPEGGKKFLWPGLYEHYVKDDAQIPLEDIKERLLFIFALEAAKTYDEKVVRSVRDANIGSIFGLGFAPWSGGTLQYINQYGLRAFVDRARDLARKYGERFNPPAFLVDMAEKGQAFTDA